MWDYQIAKPRRWSVVAIPTQSILLNLSHASIALSHYRIIALSHLFTQVVVVVFLHPFFLDLAKINKQKGMVTHYYLYFC